MRSFHHFDVFRRTTEPVTRDNNTFERTFPEFLESGCELRRTLTRTNDNGAALRRLWQMLGKRALGISGNRSFLKQFKS